MSLIRDKVVYKLWRKILIFQVIALHNTMVNAMEEKYRIL